MARLRRKKATGRRILVVDDGEDLRTSTARLLRREGHEVDTAACGDDAIRLVREWSPHVMIIDYLMPGLSGPETVKAVRAFDDTVQIVLTTGYALEYPARAMMTALDIQGYHDKADGPEKLLVWIDSALTAHDRVTTIKAHSDGLRFVLEAGPAIHRLQPINELLRNALESVVELTSAADGLVTTVNAGLLVTRESDNTRVVRARLGQFAKVDEYPDLEERVAKVIDRTIEERRLVRHDHLVGVPMQVADRCAGAILLVTEDSGSGHDDLLELIGVHIALALENVRLYELATVDSLTGLFTRAQTNDRLIKTLKLAIRTNQPLSVVMLDLDHFKQVNDRYGHVVGDMVLALVGEAIRGVIRDTDVAGRIGGEEFLVIAPSTTSDGAAGLAERLRKAIEQATLDTTGASVRMTASLAYGGLDHALQGHMFRDLGEHTFWTALSQGIVDSIDRAMYRAKADGRNRVAAAGVDGDLADVLEDALVEQREAAT